MWEICGIKGSHHSRMFPPKVLHTNNAQKASALYADPCPYCYTLTHIPLPLPPPHLKRDVQAESQAERIAEFALQWDEPTDVAFVAAHVLDSERGVM